ncbi:MAG: element excision factor XisI family protein [Leptolyngbyaceae cyanobacterium]
MNESEIPLPIEEQALLILGMSYFFKASKFNTLLAKFILLFSNAEEQDLIIAAHKEAIKQTIFHHANFIPTHRTVNLETHFDDEISRYALVKTGWERGQEIRDVLIDIKLQGRGIYIKHDKTRNGIFNDLIKRGVLRNYISRPERSNPFLRIVKNSTNELIGIWYYLGSIRIDFTNRAGRLHLLGLFFLFLTGLGFTMAIMPQINLFFYSYDLSGAGSIAIISGVLGLIAWAILDNIPDNLTSIVRTNYQDAEQRARENPNKIKPAWDIANSTLSAYFNRNLKQVDWIFRLSVAVMLLGLGLVGVGITLAYQKPESITVAIVGGIAGVITQFIGATFLFIYKSTISQANKYTETLERINSVGMAMQILDGIKESDRTDSAEELIEAKIEIAKLLLATSQESKHASSNSGKDN